MMILYREVSWWYWAVSDLLLFVGLTVAPAGFALAAALAALQIIHFRWREGNFGAFPVQVRIAFAAILALALWPPMNWLLWLLAIGTLAQAMLGYCLLARSLSLLPWNRAEPFSWPLVWRVFTARPAKGSILQGLPAAS